MRKIITTLVVVVFSAIAAVSLSPVHVDAFAMNCSLTARSTGIHQVTATVKITPDTTPYFTGAPAIISYNGVPTTTTIGSEEPATVVLKETTSGTVSAKVDDGPDITGNTVWESCGSTKVTVSQPPTSTPVIARPSPQTIPSAISEVPVPETGAASSFLHQAGWNELTATLLILTVLGLFTGLFVAVVE